jgi:hypothetical protein
VELELSPEYGRNRSGAARLYFIQTNGCKSWLKLQACHPARRYGGKTWTREINKKDVRPVFLDNGV